MANDWDDDLDTPDQEFSLDEILAEFSSSRKREGDAVAPKRRVPVTRESAPQPPEPPPQPARPTRPAPEKPPERDPEKPPRETGAKVIHFPGKAQREAPEDKPQEPARPAAPEEPEEPEEETFLTRLAKKANDFAARMFENAEPTPEEQEAERYLPGVDEERPRWQWKSRAPRRRRVRTWPDTPPQELAGKYGKGLGSLRVRRFLVFLLALPLLYLTLAVSLPLPLPGVLGERWLQIWVCAGIHALALILSYDLVLSGLTHLGADTLTVLAALATLADACTINLLDTRAGDLPYSLVSVLALGIGLWGRYMKRLTQRVSCRTAAAAKTPYLVTLDEEKWDGRAVFAKWSGTTDGFGSQIQSDDGAQRVFRPMAALLILACLLFSTISSVGKGRPELFCWCLSALLCAAASLSGALAFSLPSRFLSRRLAGVGAALAGWEGIRRQTRDAGILLTDTDLFPPGSVALNGVKVFQNHPLDKVISVTATLIRDTGSGLDRTFHELLRSQGTVYRKAEDLRCYEGGASAIIRGEQVLVGSASFMHLMEVTLPQGLNVKNAVFCAIDGELAGIFALSYALHATVRPSLSALIDNKISPILATRDFNLIPAMLRQRFKLPAERMEFPEQERRRALSDPRQRHDPPLVCVLCREGIGPLSEAVVGARRLWLATRISSVLAAIGSVIGVLLAFYLTAQAAFASLSVLNLLVFLLMWLVPTLLIAGWVNRY
ncbi:MAG: hypothetical protein ACI4O5_01345 [Oscillospiraceae bacterium]